MTLRNPSCELCPLHAGADHVCLVGNGPQRADIMLVGEAPGANEDAAGVPFIGQAGSLLNRALTDFAHLKREEVYVTNAVKCRPPNNATPKRAEIKTCVEAYLDREVKRGRPKFMLVMGNSALMGTLGKSGIMKHHGTPLTLEWEAGQRFRVMPTLHPAAVLRNPKWGEPFALDMVRFGQLTRGEIQTPETRIKLVRTPSQLQWLERKLMAAKVISWDVETYTEDDDKPYVRTNFQYWHPRKSHIVSIAFSWEEGLSAVIPLWHNESPFQARDRVHSVLKFLRQAMERTDCVYVAHNGKYDASWMAAHQVYVPQTFDTMLASHVLDENREKKLKSLSQNMLGADAYDVGEELKAAHTVPVRRLAVYNGKDTDYTLRLAKHFRKELADDRAAARLFMRLLMPASRALTAIEAVGVCIDPDRWREVHDKAQENVEILYNFINRHVPEDMRPINLKSPPQVAKLLYDHLGLEVTKKTKTGAPSTEAGVLLRLSREQIVVPALLKYRKWSKYLDTYLLPWWFEHRDDHGRIHSSYKVAGTATGRLAGQGGIQQIPRNPLIRSIVCAEDGWTLLAADYSQIELRIAAMLAGEQRMIRQFTNKEDVHLLRAMKLTNKLAEDVTKEERSRAKPVSFGFLYGMGEKHFVDYAFEEYEVDYTVAEAKRARNGFFSDYPALLPWHARQRRLVQRYQQVGSPMGRVRHLPDILSNDEKVRGEAERQGINAPVQAMASDIMLLALIELHSILPRNEARIVATIHDSILFEIRDAHVDTWTPVIRQVMEDTRRVERQFGCEIDVPITADIEVGSHFGEGKAVVA
jgi:uracil-DNA glycosylase family 4